ncbi:hypothetical protein LP52_04955 [Streptomonospora alba]|uniref:DUF4352 domain-containing protein n=2 Tax=Streptomonospora alba TaxID=183763 RepID=A0A0C2JEV4_9ACTN|nr:hypothetical protein LP52_04955 [Streptomonospora alba]
MSTGAKVGIGCGIATVTGFILMMGGCAVLILAAPDTADTDPGAPAPAADADDGGGEGSAEAPAEESYVVGDTVSHGSWDITVTSVEQGVGSVEDEFGLTEEPRGQYVVMELTVVNTGSEAAYFEARDQVLMDADGAMYEYDIPASSGLDWLEKINPGTEATGNIVFDVPTDFGLDHILVNGEGSFADGVRVDLKG